MYHYNSVSVLSLPWVRNKKEEVQPLLSSEVDFHCLVLCYKDDKHVLIYLHELKHKMLTRGTVPLLLMCILVWSRRVSLFIYIYILSYWTVNRFEVVKWYHIILFTVLAFEGWHPIYCNSNLLSQNWQVVNTVYKEYQEKYLLNI